MLIKCNQIPISVLSHFRILIPDKLILLSTKTIRQSTLLCGVITADDLNMAIVSNASLCLANDLEHHENDNHTTVSRGREDNCNPNSRTVVRWRASKNVTLVSSSRRDWFYFESVIWSRPFRWSPRWQKLRFMWNYLTSWINSRGIACEFLLAECMFVQRKEEIDSYRNDIIILVNHVDFSQSKHRPKHGHR